MSLPPINTPIRVVEVGPRDGLQNEKNFVATQAKRQFIRDLAASGLQEIEITSFVSPKWVPQLADAAELAQEFAQQPLENTKFSVLVPNLKGLERAIEVGCRRVAVFTAASETFSRKNTNRSVEESLQDLQQVVQQALQAGIEVRGYVSTVWVCPYEGDMDIERTVRVSDQLLEMGCYEVSLGDTVGRAAPREVESALQRLLQLAPADKWALHLHDTCKTALANVVVGLEAGITCFDASAGGLGGCPYAPGATGNLATESLLYLLDRCGYRTGVDREQVLLAAQRLRAAMTSE